MKKIALNKKRNKLQKKLAKGRLALMDMYHDILMGIGNPEEIQHCVLVAALFNVARITADLWDYVPVED